MLLPQNLTQTTLPHSTNRENLVSALSLLKSWTRLSCASRNSLTPDLRVREITRRFFTHRFPYSVVYRISRDEVLIVAVQHHSQNPRRWQDRISE
ncbi:MAG: hypothetical protein DMF72_14780 [Acidobacteria bacterium]|nr:MAG: hypothetical protein DMF72_14780 [Acidobacteriota bacterium]